MDQASNFRGPMTAMAGKRMLEERLHPFAVLALSGYTSL